MVLSQHADTLLYLIAFLRVVAAQHAKGRPEELAARLSRLGERAKSALQSLTPMRS